MPPACFQRSRYVILRQDKMSGGAIDFHDKQLQEPISYLVVVTMTMQEESRLSFKNDINRLA